jgi:hypothetical protein
MNDFKKYFEYLSSVPWNDIIAKISKKWDLGFSSTFELEGEAIPSFDHNIVIYDEAKIGDGVFVIFNTKSSTGKDKSGRLHNPNMWKDLAKEINKYSKVKFFSVPEINLTDLNFNNDLIVDLESIIEKHGNILSKPARTLAAKELKEKLLGKISELGKEAKNQALSAPSHGRFGDEIEGVVITGKDGKLIKIVDTEKFTSRKEKNWFFINQIINAERDFKKNIKTSPEDLVQHLDFWENQINTIEKDFDKRGQEILTIGKKFSDTKSSIEYARSLIYKMKSELKSGVAPTEVIKNFNDKKIIPESMSYFSSRQPIAEGGNVFTDMNSVVPKDLLDSSIKNAMKLANFSNLRYEIVGNKSKSFFSDIDIAVDFIEIR